MVEILTELSIGIPDSVLMEDRELRDKTVKLGQLARAASIFRVRKIVIFPDPKGSGGSENLLIRDMLQYLETPQYLRKRLYPLKPHLKYAGLLPPLKIPSHKKDASLKDGEYREAYVEEAKGGERMVFVGAPSLIPYSGSGRTGSRQTVRISIQGGVARASDASPSQSGEYWGYTVMLSNDLFETLRQFDMKVATSRFGTPLAEVWDKVSRRITDSKRCFLAFGSPKRGLFDMFRRVDVEDRFDFVLNTIPGQGVETVRTEEAVFCSLEAMMLCEAVSK
jgi:predicted SPOUT superfamily RNA methylase MTH1